ncbi:MAG: ankyrin repeat domain-containing protein [Simkaniaceae bacterium]|nr:ankyrin repeat domain-containing protein [Simkaniaceae bacterium]
MNNFSPDIAREIISYLEIGDIAELFRKPTPPPSGITACIARALGCDTQPKRGNPLLKGLITKEPKDPEGPKDLRKYGFIITIAAKRYGFQFSTVDKATATRAGEYIRNLFVIIHRLHTTPNCRGRISGPIFQNRFERWLLDSENRTPQRFVEKRARAAFFEAIKSDFPLLARRLIQSRLDPNTRNNDETPLLSLSVGYPSVTKALLSAGAISTLTNLSAETPLHFAAKRGALSVVEQLLSAGAPIDPINSSDASPLIEACRSGHHKVVSFLVARGANSHLRTRHHGHCALHYAIEANSPNSVAALLASGVSPNVLDRNGKTPLILCLSRRMPWGSQDSQHEITKLLIGAKADLEILPTRDNPLRPEDETRLTALMHATRFRDLRNLALLIASGANLNQVTPREHNTALMLAVDCRNLGAVKMLLDAGADPHLKNSSGRTAIQMARPEGYTDSRDICEEIRALLRAAMK